MSRDFIQQLKQRGILADGAMGTELYNRGFFINRCYDELNLSRPDVIKEIHKSYIEAGSGLIETNTFTANRPALSAFGLEDKTAEINIKGAQIAREAAGDDVFVAGSVGPMRWAFKGEKFNQDQLYSSFKEQIKALAKGGVDLIILETFIDINEIETAYKAARDVCKLPVVAQVSVKHLGEGKFAGLDPADAACRLDFLGADVIGVNCCDGPQGVFEAVRRMREATDKPLSAMPNCGLPQMVQGRLQYMATPEYLGEYARRYAQLGVCLIGGCCGTTPAHIREMKRFLRSVLPSLAAAPAKIECTISSSEASKEKVDIAKKSQFGAAISKGFSISVEVDPPLGVDPKRAIEGAKYLKDLGVDAVNIADGPRAMARMCPIALAQLIKSKVGIDTIVHYCCRDRNLLGIQMDLLGADALGLKNVLFITGDPPKMGHYPDATPVFDIDSISLIRFASNLNSGFDFSGRRIEGNTNFLIGCGVNPGAVDINLEVERYKKKIEGGAEFVFSQPIFDSAILEKFFELTKDVKQTPFFVGIMPIISYRNAEFLHNEVPGMQIPKDIFSRLEKAESKDAQLQIGLECASESLTQAKKLKQVRGAYIFPPLGRYDLVGKLLKKGKIG